MKAVIVISLLIFIGLISDGSFTCDFGCVHMKGPICAEDIDGNYLIFDNECKMSLANCKNHTKGYTQVNSTLCEDY